MGEVCEAAYADGCVCTGNKSVRCAACWVNENRYICGDTSHAEINAIHSQKMYVSEENNNWEM